MDNSHLNQLEEYEEIFFHSITISQPFDMVGLYGPHPTITM